MSTEASVEERLWAALFPGERYSADRAPQLAGRLREVADAMQDEQQAQGEEPQGPALKKRRKEQRGRGRDLDFGAYQQRYVALEFLYLGHAYHGFARQADTEETIEGHLFAALRKTRLVPPEATWQELKYSRGGRTDKGVSALGQVVALLLRSVGRPGEPQPAADAELDYPSLLNKVLPHDIRVLGWTDVPEDFSARFSALHREYKYLIAYTPAPAAEPAAAAGTAGAAAASDEVQQPSEEQAGAGAGQGAAAAAAGEAGPPLDIERMREAAAHLVGEHDFRNFCKVDVGQVTNFRRTILDFRLDEVPGCAWGVRRLLELNIRGTAFLWHQVRCMAAVLLMVGRGEEEPGVVATLLDLERCPRKPQFNMASEEPLLLYSCAYDGLDFRRSPQNYATVRGQLNEALTSHLVRAGLLQTIQLKLAGDPLAEAPPGGRGGRKPGGAPARHIPLMLRAKEPAVEERLLRLAATGEAGGATGAAAAPAPALAAAGAGRGG